MLRHNGEFFIIENPNTYLLSYSKFLSSFRKTLRIPVDAGRAFNSGKDMTYQDNLSSRKWYFWYLSVIIFVIRNFNFECKFILKNVRYYFWYGVDHLNSVIHTLLKNIWMKCYRMQDYLPLFWRKPRQGGDICKDNLWFIVFALGL